MRHSARAGQDDGELAPLQHPLPVPNASLLRGLFPVASVGLLPQADSPPCESAMGRAALSRVANESLVRQLTRKGLQKKQDALRNEFRRLDSGPSL